MALNCTITKASEKTRPVRGSIPEAMAERTAIAGPAPIGAVRSGRKAASKRGRAMPRTTAPTA